MFHPLLPVCKVVNVFCPGSPYVIGTMNQGMSCSPNLGLHHNFRSVSHLLRLLEGFRDDAVQKRVSEGGWGL